MTDTLIEINGKMYDVSSPTSEKFRDLYITAFGDNPNTETVMINKSPLVSIKTTNVDGFCVELFCEEEKQYKVEILDDNDKIVYQTKLQNGWFSKLNRRYYTKWKTKIYDNDTLVLEETFSLEGKRVFIVIDSASLGDTLAWIPYCEVFAKKHNCVVIVSAFKSEMYKDMYPNIEFVPPGSTVSNIHGLYRIGWYYNYDMEPEYPSSIPLQKTATNILGLSFEEIRPRLSFSIGERPIDKKYITIGMSTTAGCKEWNREGGWQGLIDKLKSLGYEIAVIQKESVNPDIQGVLDWTGDYPLSLRMNQLYYSEFYIGLGSGLSWLAWAMNKHVVMISNFSEDGHEFTDNTTRIKNLSVCHGCWNNPMFKFDKGDWYWCPEHKGTDRQFECHKTISPEMVIEQIQHLL